MSISAKGSKSSKITNLLKDRMDSEEEPDEKSAKELATTHKPSESSAELQSVHITKAANGYTSRTERKAPESKKGDVTVPESKEHVFEDPEKLLEHVRGELGCKSEAV